MDQKPISTRCCVVGGGPAGMMVGYLLARAGVAVTVLEKHGDFLRDFRGDTVHPSTLEVLHELGLLDEFLQRPHQQLATIKAQFGDKVFQLGNFARLKTRCRFIALMPQWHFLDFLAEKAKALPRFALMQSTEAVGLIEADGKVAGVRAVRHDHGGAKIEVHADLVIACDGRHSVMREQAGFKVHELSAPVDVLWFRVGRAPGDVDHILGRLDPASFMVTIDRNEYWQCAYVIPKGGIEAIKARPLAEFKAAVVKVAPNLGPKIDDIASWDDVKLLSVALDRLETWARPGLLCIGDAAHAMSPIGGVGINMAIQDAVASANLLAVKLQNGVPDLDDLSAIRKRRLFPTQVTQGFQVLVQNRVLVPQLASHALHVPFIVKLLDWLPILQTLPARFIGIGVRPEHVNLPPSDQ